MARIRKVLISAFGDESKVDVVDADFAEPARGEVQIRVEYSSLSGADINMRRGTYPFQRKAPLTPGYVAVGIVVRNGAGCMRFQPGERVACLTICDGQAELANIPEKFTVSVPQPADPKQAAGIVLDWLTAYQMLRRKAKLRAGQGIFVHGLSGAVGCALLSLAKLEGAEVFGTASPAKHAELRQMGAVPFSYRDKAWIPAMQQRGGADAVFDALGFQSFDESESILKRGGLLVAYGMNLPSLTGAPRPRHFLLEFLRVYGKNLKFWKGRRATFFGVSRRSKHYLSDLKNLLQMQAEGKIRVPIRRVFAMREIREAHRTWGSGEGMGSVIVAVADSPAERPGGQETDSRQI